MEEARITVEIKNKLPVELTDFTRSLLSIADEFERQLERNHPEEAAAEVRLYVKEMRSGSIIAEIVALAPSALQLLSYANSVATFLKHIKAGFDYLSGNSEQKPELDKISYQNLVRIVEPIAKDSGSQIIIKEVHGNVNFVLNSQESNAIQNRARKEIEALAEPIRGLREKVLLRWYQARGDAKSKTGDKAIIESIGTVPVKAMCANDAIKTQMILDDDNPFKKIYIVDVMVDTINGRAALYKILAIHEKFQDESDL